MQILVNNVFENAFHLFGNMRLNDDNDDDGP